MIRSNHFYNIRGKHLIQLSLCFTVSGEDHHEVHPAALKLAMRYHLQKLCGSLHCADSLVLYLNSPTKSDGSMLLWDVDQDGEVSYIKII